MIEENNTDITKNNQIHSRAEEIDDPDLAIANEVDEIEVVTQEPELEIDNYDFLVDEIDVVAQELELDDHPDSVVDEIDVVAQEPELDDHPDSVVDEIDVVAQEPELDDHPGSVVDEIDVVAQEPELDDHPDSVVTDAVAQSSVLGNSPAVAQSNNYQTLVEASIQALQNSINLQQQLTLNSYTTTTKNLGFIYSKQRRVAQNNTTDEMLKMLEKLFPEHHRLIQEMQEASSRKPGATQKTDSLSSQYLSSVIQMVKNLQGTS
ncbi:MAG: hypothetical protein F6K40_31100 [Okeania sp. SIO3I5]|uniref:RebB family R body protein n=1 Tax=Okeania sp. SIO3I5 TaxID=2607805 RepID=UPI0013B881BF|nr:RebB family R body protein [Okeania sp. SIO3I5]NEQ40438.1 hypothetical protein [Okeania sp. SIO3I5]